MKYLLIFILVSCSHFPQQRRGILHDYIINKANKLCESFSGLHYIVDYTLIQEEGKVSEYGGDYPCQQKYIIKCQDDRQFVELHTPVKYCIISELQIKDAILENGIEDSPKKTIIYSYY